MRRCQYCREPIEERARKCKVCGEPFYLAGRLLKFTPLVSIVITAGSLTVALLEIAERRRAVIRAETAEEARQVSTLNLTETRKAAELQFKDYQELVEKCAEQLPPDKAEAISQDVQDLRSTLQEIDETPPSEHRVWIESVDRFRAKTKYVTAGVKS